jgi:uncharacterized protein YlbG (UPF0298 family)
MKNQKYFVRIEYMVFEDVWIDQIYVNTDDINKIYSYVHKTYTNPKDIRVSTISELKHITL